MPQHHPHDLGSRQAKADFVLPPRTRTIIPITTPGTNHQDSDIPIKFSGAAPHLPTNIINDPTYKSSLQRASDQIPSTSIQQQSQSELDVTSPNYIPQWLRDVNLSNAYLCPCSPFPSLDFEAYLKAFVGAGFARCVRTVEVPPPRGTPITTNDLIPGNYAQYWLTLLQNEFALRHDQYQTFALYNQTLESIRDRPYFFRIHVPGLKEDSPRIDLGDVIHIRLLEPDSQTLEAQLVQWRRYGQSSNTVCPGFTGLMYDPRVWEIDRAQELVTLCIDGLNHPGKCNVSFLLQESKLEPACRAVHNMIFSNRWLTRMLFPNVDDCTLQTELSSASFGIPWYDDLNWEQKKAVHSIMSANYGHIPYLISGPPGTGKTKTLVETALQLTQKPGHVLVCAPSDTAADTLALRLSEHLNPSELFRLNSWTRSFAEVSDRLLLYTFSNGTAFTLPRVEHLLSYKVVVTTCRDADLLNHARLTNTCLHGLLSGVQRLIQPDNAQVPLHWSALLVDEAAQATEPDVLIPLTVVMPPHELDGPQVVCAGDQFQLGPMLLSKSHLKKSLFQRLFERTSYRDHPLSREKGVRSITVKMLPMKRPAFSNLIRNYRSHPAILSVPSSLFYNDTLIPERKTSETILSWPGWTSTGRWPVLFKQNSSPDMYESITDGNGTGNGTLYNPGEATIALETVQSLINHAKRADEDELEEKSIIVMSPYRAQVKYLRKLFRREKLYGVSIGPLEAFQGLESRIVVICTTRTSLGGRQQNPDHHVRIDQSRGLGMIDEPNRFNVAVTRAREGLIVIGHAACLVITGDLVWLNFLDFCKRTGCCSLPEGFGWPDLGGSFSEGRLERALLYATRNRAGPHSLGHDKSLPAATTRQFRLKGQRQEMDEEMWQLKELAHHEYSEHIDLVLDDRTELVADTGEESDVDSEYVIDDYDRDLDQEVRRECVTQ